MDVQKKLVKFSKPSGVMFAHKKSFFEDNTSNLAAEQSLAQLYIAQPKRTECKNCCAPLGEVLFVKMGIPYAQCVSCSHINGLHEDTEAFCNSVYVTDGGEAYGATYGSEDLQAYAKRVEDIYIPKAAFLKEALLLDGSDPSALRYADIGAGAGYFAAGLVDAGLTQVRAFEVSPSLVALSKAMRPDVDMTLTGLTDTVMLAKTVEAEVVSLIGVLEHVRNPREVLAALSENPQVRYVYVLVPMFSPSVFIELAFPQVASRLLGVEHTHLYTEKSLRHVTSEFGMQPVGEWWFGADMMDWYRSLAVTISATAVNAPALPVLRDMVVPLIDALQGAVDHSKLCSEVHMVFKVR